MTKNEKNYISNTFRDKKEEIQKYLDHYNKIGDKENVNYFLAQMKLINELYNEYFKSILE